jgi:hypothetical protein
MLACAMQVDAAYSLAPSEEEGIVRENVCWRMLAYAMQVDAAYSLAPSEEEGKQVYAD